MTAAPTATFSVTICHTNGDSLSPAAIRWVDPAFQPSRNLGERVDTVDIAVFRGHGARHFAEVSMGGKFVGTLAGGPGTGIHPVGHGWHTWLRTPRLSLRLTEIVREAISKVGA